ncbi:TonB-dependent receptor [Brenneria tiliae]|uniref:TonB-dependent receptor n=1 Tax=Brenneria tiliae TaxID=2914984 RepID=UPI002014B9CD|nr:TonB-dependent receptor [Brenneria tiliae]MCL2898313.1 TonB-dependent receptor [Brenneria tiliae]MCL2902663.1 TonB-dependent receptor [Brenneria tiliae]
MQHQPRTVRHKKTSGVFFNAACGGQDARHKKTSGAALVAGGLFAALSAAAPAQETEQSEQQLAPVIVTAPRRAESLQKVPAAISVVSSEEIEEGGLRTTKDVAKFIPGAQGWNTESRARPRFFIRGVGSNEATNNTVNPIGFYADEVYYNNNLFTGTPLFDLQRVEVLRGPQGTLWGKNTTGGAFHFISRKPSFETDGNAKLQFGNLDSRLFQGAVGGALKDDVLAGRAALHYEERGGLAKNTTTGNDVGDYEDIAGRFQLLALISPELDALLNVHVRRLDGTQNPWYSVTRNGAPDVNGYVAPIGNGSGDRKHVAYNFDLPLKVETEGASLAFNWDLGGYTLTSVTAIDHGRRSGLVEGDYTPYEYATGGSARSYSRNEVTQRSQEFRLVSPPEERFTWIAGTYLFRDDNESYGAGGKLTGDAATQSFNTTSFEQDTTSAALFGSVGFQFTERFKLSGGLRHTYEKSGIDLTTLYATGASPYVVNGKWWSPGALENAGLATYYSTDGRIKKSWSNFGYDITPEYQIDDNQLVYFRHASGFRSGNYNTYITPNGVSGVSQFSVVDPEKLKSYEIGYKSTWLNQRLVVNAAAYHYDYQNMQLVVNQVLNNIFYPTLMNAGSGKVDGIELEAAFQLTESLRLRANLSRLRTEFDELLAGGRNYKGYGFARVPQTTALLGVDYRTALAGGTLALGTDWSYTSKHHFNVTNDSDLYALQQAYWLGSVHASYTLPGDRVTVGAYVNNVTDRRYKNQAMLYQGGTDATNGHYPTGYGDPRTFGVSLAYRF